MTVTVLILPKITLPRQSFAIKEISYNILIGIGHKLYEKLQKKRWGKGEKHGRMDQSTQYFKRTLMYLAGNV
jgi:hypothetical protein